MDLRKLNDKPIKELTVAQLQEIITKSVDEAFQEVIEKMNIPKISYAMDKIKETQTAYKARKRVSANKMIVKAKRPFSLEQKELMKLSENSFAEWDNSEDEIYDTM